MVLRSADTAIVLAALACAAPDANGTGGDVGPHLVPPSLSSSPSGSVEDAFEAPPQGPVDILFVLDNSGTMRDEVLADMAVQMPYLLERLDGYELDYHVGAVTTDMTDTAQRGKLLGVDGRLWVDADLPDRAGAVERLFAEVPQGTYDERGREAAYSALEVQKDDYNAGFVREEAALHIVVVSDEDDHSSQIMLSEFADYLGNLKEWPGQVRFSSIVSPAPGCRIQRGGDYLLLTEGVGGFAWDICDPAWRDAIDGLVQWTPNLPFPGVFELSSTPRPESIEVEVVAKGVVYVPVRDETFWYEPEDNRVRIDASMLFDRAEVKIRYQSALE